MNLSWDTEEYHVYDHFQTYGISKVSIIRDEDGYSRGFGFVTFRRHESAIRALTEMQGSALDHMILHLDWAKEKKEKKVVDGHAPDRRKTKKANGKKTNNNKKSRSETGWTEVNAKERPRCETSR